MENFIISSFHSSTKAFYWSLGVDDSPWKLIQKMGRIGRIAEEKALFILIQEKKKKYNGKKVLPW